MSNRENSCESLDRSKLMLKKIPGNSGKIHGHFGKKWGLDDWV
ncbi:MAG: hypothetical protein QNJ38_17820 [Prochloraceae cyanobacterium]|nr:hypothetical protein [Prochloraceae cyanobacterium]